MPRLHRRAGLTLVRAGDPWNEGESAIIPAHPGAPTLRLVVHPDQILLHLLLQVCERLRLPLSSRRLRCSASGGHGVRHLRDCHRHANFSGGNWEPCDIFQPLGPRRPGPGDRAISRGARRSPIPSTAPDSSDPVDLQGACVDGAGLGRGLVPQVLGHLGEPAFSGESCPLLEGKLCGYAAPPYTDTSAPRRLIACEGERRRT